MPGCWKCKGRLYLVDTIAGDPEVLQTDAETYYEKLLKKSLSTPDIFSIPGGGEVKLEDSCVCFVPLYRNNPTCKLLLLTDPKDKETVLAVYLSQRWWPVEDVVKTADPARDGLILVQTFGERIVLFVLNCIIFGMLEGSSANDAFFLPHSATERAKILWRNGEAAAFYSVKMKGSLCDGTTSQCYLLPVLDTIFVQRKYRRGGLGMKMLHDFCQSFLAEDALGISCPISAAMYQVCQKFLQAHPEEQKRLWEVEAPGDWSQRLNIWLKIQMESSPSGKAEVGSCMEKTPTTKPRQLDHMNKEVYKRAIANMPPIQEKRHWKRYIYLWISYALYEELEAKDAERTRQVYQACLELLPHKKFTFAKMWLLYAQFEIRQKNLPLARRALGTSIGKCPKNKLFKGYIELELQLREFDRCRKLYEKFLEFAPENCMSWIKFAELETILGDIDCARAIYELAISQPWLDMPEVLWKSYTDFEMEQEECERARSLYRRLLQRTQRGKVWISLARFELLAGQEERLQRCQQIYQEANKAMCSCEEKEERVMLLESWRSFEDEFGTDATKERIDKLMPEKIKKRRKLQAKDGSDAGWEEYCDYIFPEDTACQPNLKLLAMAKLWKKQQLESEDATMDPNKDIDESQT
ncbi:crooked neck-like protein 1 isoform X2 [Pyrgilauda ruficollis]|uniref:crooked neck-like protein 1 isoform X2 n=1 Tax=Pyrgilauda ruficollis TaxID=221976 RepID=UPI001B85B62B|nr:crooked neck-like protein 1 isoform X2 [Pyrgilauda ruficollis]